MDIKTALEQSCKVNIDRKLLKRLRDIRVRFMNKNSDHLEFFSGNLIGVNPVRYIPSKDKEEWFNDIVLIDTLAAKRYLREIDEKDLNPDWIRANDLVNLSSIWLMYKIFNEKSFTINEKIAGMTDTILMLQYKFLTSILTRYLPYPTDRSIATATYEALSMKFEIRQYGSWQGLLENRAKDIINIRSIHYNTITKMDTVAGVVYMISDVQGRLKAVCQKIY